MPEVSVVVVTYQSAGTIAACLASLPEGVEAIVVDNGSSDQTLAIVKAGFPGATAIAAGENMGFGAACNRGAAAAKGDVLLMLNPDARLEPGALEALVAALEADPGLGAVGPLVLDAEGVPELSWGDDPGLVFEWRRAREQHGRSPRPAPPAARTAVDWVTGGCLAVRRSAWEAVGGFDSGYFLYFEDADLCRRLRLAGWTVAFEPAAVARHARGESARHVGAQVARWYRESQLTYYTRHRGPLEIWVLKLYLALKRRKEAAL